MNNKLNGKNLLVICFILLSVSSKAQIFLEGDHIPSIYPTSAAFGDLNGDGFIDLVQAYMYFSDDIPENANKVWLNNGDMTFTFHTELGNYPTVDIEIADMDNDGDLDLIAGSDGNFVNRIWLNDGLGNFTVGQSFGNRDVSSLAIADFNEDGYPDIIFGVSDIGTDDMLYINNGNGTVTMDTDIPFTSGSRTSDVRTTDINNDGHMDFVLSKASTNLQILEESEVWTGFGDGTFYKSPQIFPLVGSGSTVAADYNGDGEMDLVFLEEGNVNGYLNDGSSLFQHSTVLYSGASIRDIDMIDADVDGDLDLVVARYADDDAYESLILFNDGNGEFTDGSEQISIANTVRIEAFDIDEDRDMDLFIVNRTEQDNVFWINQTDPPLAIHDTETIKLILYPNPAGNLLHVQAKTAIENVSIYNILGQQIYFKHIDASNFEVDISNLTSGEYIVKILANGQLVAKKILKQ